MPDVVFTTTEVEALLSRVEAKSVDKTAFAEALYRLDPDSLNRWFYDTISVTDSLSLNVAKVLADSVSMSDSFSTAVQYSRSFSDSVTFSDSAVPLLEILRSFTDSVSFSETQAINLSKALSDSLAVTDSVSTALTAEKTLSDSLSISDTFSIENSLGDPADSFTLSDSFVLTTTIIRALNDNPMNARPLN